MNPIPTRQQLIKEYHALFGEKGTRPPYWPTEVTLTPIARFNNNHSILDANFPTWNAAFVPNSRTVLSEGVNHSDESALMRFVSNTMKNKNGPITTFVAVGQTDRDNPDDANFKDYFQSGSPIDAKTFFQLLITKTPHCRRITQNTVLPLLDAVQFSQFLFYAFDEHNQPPRSLSVRSHALCMYVPQWPDHGVMGFEQADQLALLLMALIDPVNLTHCRAGMGRSVTLICARLTIRENFHELNDFTTLHKAYISIVDRVRKIKAGAMYDAAQYALGFQLVTEMAELAQSDKYKAACSELHAALSSTITSPDPVSTQGIFAYKNPLIAQGQTQRTLASGYVPDGFEGIWTNGDGGKSNAVLALQYIQSLFDILYITVANASSDETTSEEIKTSFKSCFIDATSKVPALLGKIAAQCQQWHIRTEDATQLWRELDRTVESVSKLLACESLIQFEQVDMPLQGPIAAWQVLLQHSQTQLTKKFPSCAIPEPKFTTLVELLNSVNGAASHSL